MDSSVYKKDHWEADTLSVVKRERGQCFLPRNGPSPYIPITQKQYLLALKRK